MAVLSPEERQANAEQERLEKAYPSIYGQKPKEREFSIYDEWIKPEPESEPPAPAPAPKSPPAPAYNTTVSWMIRRDWEDVAQSLETQLKNNIQRLLDGYEASTGRDIGRLAYEIKRLIDERLC